MQNVYQFRIFILATMAAERKRHGANTETTGRPTRQGNRSYPEIGHDWHENAGAIGECAITLGDFASAFGKIATRDGPDAERTDSFPEDRN
jgi:hypothetical protein